MRLPVVLAIASALAAGASSAQADDMPDLSALVAAQAAEIENLKARLQVLESRSAPPAAPPAAPSPLTTEIRWTPLPELASADRRFRFRPKGRLFYDTAWTGGSDHAARNISGAEVRALWLGFEGAADDFNYALTVDLANNDVAIRNAYIAWRGHVPAGDVEITLGNRLSERGLDGSSSSEAVSFLERNAVALAISPLNGLYGLGLTGKLYGRGWHVAAQVAGDDINHPGLTRDTVATMVRAHWNPILRETRAIHLAAWGFHEAFSSGVTRMTRTTAWAGHFNDNLQVAMGVVENPATAVGYGVEVGGLAGPGWIFAEYGERRIHPSTRAVTLKAWAVSAGWFLTGERAPYATRSGTFVRSRPASPLSEGGMGSVEIAGRLQRLDNRDALMGAAAREVTLGLNWKPEEWLRLMLNASLWRMEAVAGPFGGRDGGEAVTSRLQVSF